MTKRKKNKVGAARWRAEIQPVAEFASHRGFQAALSQRLAVRFGGPKNKWRVMINEWLALNDRNKEPLSGTGLVLLDEARALMREWPAEAARKEGPNNCK